MVQTLDRTLQKRHVSNVELDSFLGNELTRFGHFFVSLGTKRTIVPSGKLVFQIPCGLSVTDQDEGVLVGGLDAGKAAILIQVRGEWNS